MLSSPAIKTNGNVILPKKFSDCTILDSTIFCKPTGNSNAVADEDIVTINKATSRPIKILFFICTFL